MKKILIPTDFTLESLKLAEHAIELYPEEVVSLVLVYPYRFSLWEGELYTFSPSTIIAECTTDEFSVARNDLINRYFKNINAIELELFAGVNSLAFKNFKEYHNIQTAILPQKKFLDTPLHETADLFNFIQKCVPEVHTLAIEKEGAPEMSAAKMESGILNTIKKAFQALG